MDFEQLRKDVEDGSPGPWLYVDTDGDHAIVDEDGDEVVDCDYSSEEDCRRIARVPDLERIALAAEKFRKAEMAFNNPLTPEDVYSVSRKITEARAELFALLKGI